MNPDHPSENREDASVPEKAESSLGPKPEELELQNGESPGSTPLEDATSEDAISEEVTSEEEASEKATPDEATSQRVFRPGGFPIEAWILLLPTLIFFCYQLSPIATRIEAALTYPFQMDAEEGFVYQQGLDLWENRSIYSSIEEEPYLVGNYPPLFPWIVSKLIAPTRNGLPLGRAVVVYASMILAVTLLLYVFWRTGRILPSLLAPLLFMITYEFHNWSAFCRVDLPALTLTLLGLFAFILIRPRWGAAVAAVIFVLAAFTRQTAILAPIACCLSMLLHDRRRLIWFLVPYLGLGLTSFIVFNVLTEGGFFLHLVRYNQNEMDWYSFRRIMRNEIWYFYRWWIIAIALGTISLFLAGKAGRDSTPSVRTGFHSPPHARGVTGFYALLAAASLVGFAKVGSAPNYALEPLAAAALFGMETLGRLCDASAYGPPSRRIVGRAGASLMALALLFHTGRLAREREEGTRLYQIMFSSANPSDIDVDSGRQVLSVVQRTEGDILSEHPIFAILAGKRVLYEPFIMSRLAAEGLWDEEKINSKIRDNRFALIITEQDLRQVDQGLHIWRFTKTMARTIVENYSLKHVIRPQSRFQPGLRHTFYLWTPADRRLPDESANVIASSSAIR